MPSRTYSNKSVVAPLRARRSAVEYVPFSWTLFLLAVFQFSVWSLGVASATAAQGYYTAHTSSFKVADDQSPIQQQQQQLLQAQELLEELRRSSQLAQRQLQESEAAHAHSSAAPKLKSHTQEGVLAAQQLQLDFLTKLAGVGNNNRGEKAAAATLNHLFHARAFSV